VSCACDIQKLWHKMQHSTNLRQRRSLSNSIQLPFMNLLLKSCYEPTRMSKFVYNTILTHLHRTCWCSFITVSIIVLINLLQLLKCLNSTSIKLHCTWNWLSNKQKYATCCIVCILKKYQLVKNLQTFPNQKLLWSQLFQTRQIPVTYRNRISDVVPMNIFVWEQRSHRLFCTSGNICITAFPEFVY